MIFKDRKEAGEKLAEKLRNYANKKDTVVLGLPRGGVVVAFEAAQKLNLPLDILVPRKIGLPQDPEMAIGAIAEGFDGIFNNEIIKELNISKEEIKNEVKKEKEEMARRLKLYRGEKPPLDLKGKTAIIVDDGIATGYTMLASIFSAKAKGAKKVIVAAPVIALDTIGKIKKESDELVYLDAPEIFWSVGMFYEDFPQIEDNEVMRLLKIAYK
ncbi:phosphoribosyltransferase [Candidatus Azambacteria bacterium]|nr:phosphoribosyltransferase [Candidatus Azambacteria bacterium]